MHTTQMHLIYTYCTHVEKYIGYYKYIFNLIGSQLKLMGQLGTGGGAREPGGNGQTYNTVETLRQIIKEKTSCIIHLPP